MQLLYHDKKRDLLIYPAASTRTDYVLKYIPEAKQVNGYVAVPRTLRNCQVLGYFNYPMPAIITDENYDWPIEPGRTALPHQKIYANFQAVHRRCLNLGDPGTMKTLSSLWAAEFIKKQYPGLRILIVAPLTILETVWAAAIFKNFLGRLSFEILHGSQEKRRALLAKKPDVAIINFDGVNVGALTRNKLELAGFSADLANDKDIKLVIVDEARGYGDATSLRSRIARMVFKDRPYLWQLCGSPTPQAPTDCYGMAKLHNNAGGESFRSFQLRTMTKVSQFKWVPQRDGYEKARRLLTPAIRFGLDEIWSGPDQTIQLREVALSDEQKKLMADLKRDLQVALKGQVISAVHEAAARTKFMQISMGAVYDASHKYHLVDAKPRFAEVEEIIKSTQRKVVLFCPLTSVLHVLYKFLSKTWRCEFVNGEVTGKQRTAAIKRFESEPDVKVMIADPTVVSHGVNEFVVADTGIWFGPVDRVDDWIQGNKRIRRPGQKFPSTIFQIVSNKLEKEIFRRLESNETLQGAMLKAVREGWL